ncbi:MAG TPA: hypothetical protein VK624_12825 [Steroidobacteraceae bacterium]|jgi:hypothetical protein|nr:hypothetical protein [Steroidobacteraceae bacterium]
MKHVFNALLLVGALAGAQAYAACDYPIAPGKFPDGTQATKEEMLTAKHAVEKYNTDIDGYLTCIKSEFDAKLAAQTDATPEQKAEMERVQSQKHNAAVEEVTAVAARFNEQLRAWKAKNMPEKKPS